MEWRPTIRVLDLDLSSLLEQQFPDRQVAVSRCNVELHEIPDIYSHAKRILFFFFVFRILCFSPELLHDHPGHSSQLRSAPSPGYQPASTPLLPHDIRRFAPA